MVRWEGHMGKFLDFDSLGNTYAREQMFSQEAHCRGRQAGVLMGMGQDRKTH